MKPALERVKVPDISAKRELDVAPPAPGRVAPELETVLG